MKTTKELLGERIKELRKVRKMTQEMLAEKVDIATRYVSFIEVGKNAPSLETLENIARALEVDVRTLFDFGHLEARPANIEEINNLLKEMTDEDVRKVHRIAKVFVK